MRLLTCAFLVLLSGAAQGEELPPPPPPLPPPPPPVAKPPFEKPPVDNSAPRRVPLAPPVSDPDKKWLENAAPKPPFTTLEGEGNFRAIFPDATILETKTKERTSWLALSLSLGNGKFTELELTLSDPLNKKFKVRVDEHGYLHDCDKFEATFERLPGFLQEAVLREDASVTPDAKFDVSYGWDGDPLLKVSGKNGKKKIKTRAFAPYVDLSKHAQVEKKK